MYLNSPHFGVGSSFFVGVICNAATLAPSLRGLSAEQADWGSVLSINDTPSVKNQRFLPPPSKREARERQKILKNVERKPLFI